MKKYLLLAAIFFCTAISLAQVPHALNYQTVVRNSIGDIEINKLVSFKISILKGSATGTEVYSETHNKVTNEFGLVTIEVGNGTVVSGIFNNISWGSDIYFLKTEFDINGGTSYTFMGTSQLLSVPYSIYAERAGNAEDDFDKDSTNEIQQITLNGNSLDLSKNGGSVVLTGVIDLDADPTNELQALSVSGDTLFLSMGNYVIIPSTMDTLWKNNNHGLYINDGNVGIGTNSFPIDSSFSRRYLTIIGDTNSGVFEMGTNANDANGASVGLIQWSDKNAVAGNRRIAAIGASLYGLTPNNKGGGLNFYTKSDNGSGMLERLKIDTSGNIGIGISNPIYKLEINGGMGLSGIITNYGLNSGVNTREVYDNGDTLRYSESIVFNPGTNGSYEYDVLVPDTSYDVGYRFFRRTNTSGDKYIAFYRGNNTTTVSGLIGVDGYNSYFQLHGGNFGIGTSSPVSKVTVTGGDVYVTDYTKGIILKASNGNCYRVTVSTTGTIVSTLITCP